ncbi:hypothetical protein CTEN210_05827 [Chaetoceros tenuissimus]|uniref:NmrA-like domain-containing protein n=1 Tax=Chaetoceros tenuissimus TaxID=426638 RepID=A0AAD3H3V6_9STRA|nr:hypothetical protein CTEN210_05827 [Chaetoceros tenuissimus]
MAAGFITWQHIVALLWMMSWTFVAGGKTSNSSSSSAQLPSSTLSPSILVVGATGTTGLRAIQGLLDVGYTPSQLKILTRNKSKSKMKQLKQLGFNLVQADLQCPSSLRNIGKDCFGCYIHATGGDTAELDTSELVPKQDHGVKRIQQKHDIEKIITESRWNTHFTSLRANLFGEELWKKYTRPDILKGIYPLSVNRWRKIYLTSVRDMGRLAGTVIARNHDNTQEKFHQSTTRILNVAGDHLTAPQIARIFGTAQGMKCRHYNNRQFTKVAKESFPELYEQIHFLQHSREKTNIKRLKKEFSGLITSFAEFVDETQWAVSEKAFEDLSRPETLEF